MTALEVATDHYRDRSKLVADTAAVATDAWRSVGFGSLLSAWSREAAQLAVVVAGAQATAAQVADTYVSTALAEQGLGTRAAGQVQPRLLAGTASDGRDLVSLLFQPARTVALFQSQGWDTDRAVAAGLAVLEMIVRTQVADAGRVADGIAITTRPGAGGYTRMTAGPTTCARCAVLAGRVYRWSDGFDRHPQCDCVHIPSAEAIAGDLTMDPDALVRAGRVRLTKGEQEAFDNGADLAQVVNARREGGLYVAGGREFTRESTTARGSSPTRPRLTPDQILVEAQENRQEAIRLLRLHGYIR